MNRFGTQYQPTNPFLAQSAVYRYGFNGQQIELEITGNHNHFSAEFWIYRSDIGRRYEIDPLYFYAAWTSTYSTFQNNPVLLTDFLGLSPGDPVKIAISGSYENASTASAVRSTLPSEAEDGQVVSFDFSEGNYTNVTATYSKEKDSWEIVGTINFGRSNDLIVTQRIERDYGGNGAWSMESMAKYYGVVYETKNKILESVVSAADAAAPVNGVVGQIADMVEVAANESLKQPSKYYDPNAAQGAKTLTKIVKVANVTSVISTAIDAGTHCVKALNHFANGNTKEGWEEVAKTGGSIAAAIAGGASYGMIGGPVGMVVGIGVAVLWNWASDQDWW